MSRAANQHKAPRVFYRTKAMTGRSLEGPEQLKPVPYDLSFLINAVLSSTRICMQVKKIRTNVSGQIQKRCYKIKHVVIIISYSSCPEAYCAQL